MAVVVLASGSALFANAVVVRHIVGSVALEGHGQDCAQKLVTSLGIWGLLCCGLFIVGWRWMIATRARIAGCLAIGSVALYVAISLPFWWYVNDDAGISFTYARNLAEGRGLVFNEGDAPLEGYSNPLWVLVLAGAHCCEVDIRLAAKVMGLVLGIACLPIVWGIVRHRAPLGWIALPLVATNAAYVIWTNSGLETSLHAVLLTVIVLFLSQPPHSASRNPGLALALSLLAVCRPEGILFTAVVAVYTITAARRRRSPVVRGAAFLLVPAAVFLVMVIFRLLYFHDILPNTFYAKASHSNPLRVFNPLSGGWRYVATAATGCGWSLLLIPMFLAALRRQARSPAVLPILAVVAGQVFFVVSVGGDWMGEFRFLAPVVPSLSVLIALGLSELWTIVRGTTGRRWEAALLCTALPLIMMIGQLPRMISFADRPTTSLDAVARIGEYFVELARESGIESPTLLHHDAGGTSYVAQIRLIDLAGLCDRTIGRSWRDRERMRQYIFHERRPSFIYSGPWFARRIGLESYPEFESDYCPLPPAPSPDLDGYIRRVRRDLAPRVCGDHAATLGTRPSRDEPGGAR